MNDVLSYLKQLININDIVVVATSGGPDSMCLLHLLCELIDCKNFQIVVAHVNHKLRSESEEEAKFVCEYASKNHLIYEYMEIGEYVESNTENEARKKRYSFFHDLVSKYQAKFLMTAHHGDDLMETVLMRLTRGSSLKGYSGFQKEANMGSYTLVRPLLEHTKEDILKYMHEHKLSYYVDQSNYSTQYTRNRFRMDVLPFFKKENPKVHLKFLEFSQELFQMNSFLDNMILKLVREVKTKDGYSISKLNNLDPFLLEKVIEYELASFYQNDITLIQKKHRSQIKELILSSKTTGVIYLPKKSLAIKDYDIFKLDHTKEKKSYYYEFQSVVKLPTGVIKQISKSDKKSNFIIRLNSSDICLPIIIRSRMEGDKIAVKNLNGTQKVKDILINEKISREKRAVLPIVTDSKNVVLWIPGVKKSKFDVETNGIYDIILSYEEEK